MRRGRSGRAWTVSSWHSTNAPPFMTTSRFLRSCKTVISATGSPLTTSKSGDLTGSRSCRGHRFMPSNSAPLWVAHLMHFERRNTCALDVSFELAGVVAMRHRGGAEIVADHELDAGGLRLGQSPVGILQSAFHLVDAGPIALAGAPLLLHHHVGEVEARDDESSAAAPAARYIRRPSCRNGR